MSKSYTDWLEKALGDMMPDWVCDDLMDMPEEGEKCCALCNKSSPDGDCFFRLFMRQRAEGNDENQKQVTGKLKNPDDSLLTADTDDSKESKSKLNEKLQSSQETSTISKEDSTNDTISRQAAIDDIKANANSVTDALIIIDNFPPSEPEKTGDIIIGIDMPHGSDKGVATTFRKKHGKLVLEEVKEVIVDTPSERESGEWIEHDPNCDGLAKVYECPRCGEEVNGEPTNFCPNCGADMRGEEE